LPLDGKAVRRHLARHDRLAQPVARVEQQLAALAGGRIGGEQHARDIGRYHHLDDDGHRNVDVTHAHAPAVGNRAGRPERGPAASHRREQGIGAAYVQQRFLLPCERAAGQILGGGRGAHRHGRHVAQARIGRQHCRTERVQQRAAVETGLDRGCGAREGGLVIRVSCGECGIDGRLDRVRFGEAAIGRGGDKEAVGHREAGGGHTRQRRALPAGERQGGLPAREREHQRQSGGLCRHWVDRSSILVISH
jgi:hypothetical protein